MVLDGELVASGRLAVAVVQDLQLEDAQPNPGTDLELGVGHPDHARLHFDFVPPTSLKKGKQAIILQSPAKTVIQNPVLGYDTIYLSVW